MKSHTPTAGRWSKRMWGCRDFLGSPLTLTKCSYLQSLRSFVWTLQECQSLSQYNSAVLNNMPLWAIVWKLQSRPELPSLAASTSESPAGLPKGCWECAPYTKGVSSNYFSKQLYLNSHESLPGTSHTKEISMCSKPLDHINPSFLYSLFVWKWKFEIPLECSHPKKDDHLPGGLCFTCLFLF